MSAGRFLLYPRSPLVVTDAGGQRVEIWYETHIDMKAVARLAHRAAASKNKTTTDGPISIRVIETESAPATPAAQIGKEEKHNGTCNPPPAARRV